MKAIVVGLLLLGLTSSALPVDIDIDRRMRRDLSVDWSWNTDDAAGQESPKETQRTEAQEEERVSNKTPKTRCSIEGIWYNHLGSEMIINSTAENGVLRGEFRTAVEREHGTAGEGAARLIGHTSMNGEHPTFGLTVVWRNGRSVTSWTGQCHLCDGKESLMTTWVLTSKTDTCDEYWMANRIGQDTFFRHEVKDGPRRHDNTHTPRDFARHLEQEQLDDQLDL